MTDTEDLTVSHAPFCHIITIYLKHRLFVGAHCFMYHQSRWPVSITRTAVDFRWTLKTAPLLYSESHDFFPEHSEIETKIPAAEFGGTRFVMSHNKLKRRARISHGLDGDRTIAKARQTEFSEAFCGPDVWGEFSPSCFYYLHLGL